MGTLRTFAVLGLLLMASTVAATEPGEAPDQVQQETDEATSVVAPKSEAEESRSSVEITQDAQSDLLAIDLLSTIAPMWRPIPTPIPNYCPSCQPCNSTAACGRDPHNGSSLGVCSPPPNSWCPGTTTSVCICY